MKITSQEHKLIKPIMLTSRLKILWCQITFGALLHLGE